MTVESPQERENGDATPATEELEEPSTEKEPEEEPKAAEPAEAEPSHEAVGIGVIGGPLVDPDPSPENG